MLLRPASQFKEGARGMGHGHSGFARIATGPGETKEKTNIFKALETVL